MAQAVPVQVRPWAPFKTIDRAYWQLLSIVFAHGPIPVQVLYLYSRGVDLYAFYV